MGRLILQASAVAVAAVMLSLRLVPVMPAAAGEPLTVVELFTSQGCPRCPPADALLRELADEPGVLALSLHVDYWDYLGWQDPFATAGGTRRQRAYADRFDLPYVYTPQMVIQGVTHLPGTDASTVRNRISEAPRADRVSVTLTRRDPDDLSVHLRGGPGRNPDGGADVWLVVFDRERSMEVQSGHNAGSRLRHVNVVTELRRIGTWDGGNHRLTVPLPVADDRTTGAATVAVMVQARETGQIMGATRLPIAP